MDKHRRIEIAVAEHHRDVWQVGTDRVTVLRVGQIVDAHVDCATVVEKQEVMRRAGLVEAHHHRPSLIAGTMMILASSERYRYRQRTEQTQYRNKSHVTSYVYRTAWNRSRVKDGGSRSLPGLTATLRSSVLDRW